MNNKILSTSGKSFQKFICQLTENLPRPAAKFITELLCGMLFSNNLILTNIAAKVPRRATVTATAKRFRRQLSNERLVLEDLLSNYFSIVRRRIDSDSLFITDLTDLAKPYARKMENIAQVRDGDKDCLVSGYWCFELYTVDKAGVIWPLIIWPYSLLEQGVLSENQQILRLLSIVDRYFGPYFGIYLFDRGFDRINLIEPFLASKRRFIIRQRGDRTVVLENGVHIILRDLVEHLFAESGDYLVYKRVYLPDTDVPLYVVAYKAAGYDEPVILLTSMVAENRDLAAQVRNRFHRRWDCETSVEFLKSKIGIERFAVRRYKGMQRLICLACMAMGFLSYLQSRCKDICRWVNDRIRYCRQPKRLWFYRFIIALQEAFFSRAKMCLTAWCRAP